MEASHDTRTADNAALAGGAQVELVVDNGRQQGARRTLSFPVTLIGRHASCDLHLNAEGIAPLHCVLVQGAGGLMLRDLQGKNRTLVNDQPASICTLRHGDHLAIGPFRFQVAFPTNPPATPPVPSASAETDQPSVPVERETLLRQEQERLRIEAEALAVRQAALAQEEARFQQRRLALEQQREQLQSRLKQEQETLRREADAQVEAEKTRVRSEIDSRLGAEKESLRQQLDAVASYKAQLEEEDERLKQRWLTLDQQREQTQAKLRQEKDALRVQTAAVAAQQSALSEEEARLQQRRVALQQQEEQLSAHLEDKQRRLQELQEQTREARTALQNERAAYEARVAQTTREISIARAELGDGQAQVQAQRQHLIELRRRLKRRWHRHWAGERAAMQRREAEVDQERQELAREGDRLQRDREALAQARLRLNGEVELGRRQIGAGWTELRQQRHQFEQRAATERAELQQRRRELDHQEADLLALEHDLADQRAEWEARRQLIDQETEGLENRIRNQRRRVLDLEQEIARLQQARRELRLPEKNATEATVSATTASKLSFSGARPQPSPDAFNDAMLQRLAELEQLAEELADQRLHLAEQWERLVQAQHEWCREHEAATVEWEAIGQRLAAREQVLEANEARLAKDGREAVQGRQRLEGWQARLAAREASWEAERDRLRADVEARERLVEQRLRAIAGLHTRWARQRQKELKRLQTEREAGDQLCKEFAALRDEWVHRGAALEQEQRALAEKTLALEQHRQETLHQSASPELIERRLEQLRRRWTMTFAASEQSLTQEREALKAEATRLEQLYHGFRHKIQEAATEAADETLMQTSRAHGQLQLADETAQLQNRLSVLQSHCQRYEQERSQLRDEIDRLAGVLMEEGQTMAPVQINQAA
jgi:pSer/pThr/pTyr-binding forkhead associated (FHA) protein